MWNIWLGRVSCHVQSYCRELRWSLLFVQKLVGGKSPAPDMLTVGDGGNRRIHGAETTPVDVGSRSPSVGLTAVTDVPVGTIVEPAIDVNTDVYPSVCLCLFSYLKKYYMEFYICRNSFQNYYFYLSKFICYFWLALFYLWQVSLILIAYMQLTVLQFPIFSITQFLSFL